jgi:hypothetical protein
MSRWYIITEHLKAGPFKEGFVKQLYEQGVIRDDSLIWNEGDTKAQSYQQYFYPQEQLINVINVQDEVSIDFTQLEESPPELFIEKTGSHEISDLWQQFLAEEKNDEVPEASSESIPEPAFEISEELKVVSKEEPTIEQEQSHDFLDTVIEELPDIPTEEVPDQILGPDVVVPPPPPLEEEFQSENEEQQKTSDSWEEFEVQIVEAPVVNVENLEAHNTENILAQIKPVEANEEAPENILTHEVKAEKVNTVLINIKSSFEKLGLIVLFASIVFVVIFVFMFIKEIYFPKKSLMEPVLKKDTRAVYKHPLEFDLNNIEKFRDYFSIMQSIEEKSKGESLLIKGFVLKAKQCYRGNFFMFEGGATELTQSDFVVDEIVKEHEKKVKFFTHKCTKHELKVTFKADIGMGKKTTLNAYYCPSYVDKLTDFVRRYNLSHECYGARDFDECFGRTEKQLGELYDDFILDPQTIAKAYIELVIYLVHEKGRLENADGMQTLKECQK